MVSDNNSGQSRVHPIADERIKAHILIADDEASLAEALCNMLSNEGYEVTVVRDGVEAVDAVGRFHPDLVILDIMMPRLDGFGACERIRRIDPDIAVIILSAKSDIIDKKVGFRAGADDYLTKPFSMEEMLLRVEALLRRRSRQMATANSDDDHPDAEQKLMKPVRIGDLVIDPLHYEVTVRGKQASLTPKEFQILALMADSPGKAFTRQDLIESIWGADYDATAISIPVYVRRIREKIEEDPSNPQYLKTVWHYGYRLGD